MQQLDKLYMPEVYHFTAKSKRADRVLWMRDIKQILAKHKEEPDAIFDMSEVERIAEPALRHLIRSLPLGERLLIRRPNDFVWALLEPISERTNKYATIWEKRRKDA